jgi:hypothetical protein
MIICDNCNAVNDEAMNMNWTICLKHDYVQNIACRRCDNISLRTYRLDYEIIILEETDCDTRRDSRAHGGKL